MDGGERLIKIEHTYPALGAIRAHFELMGYEVKILTAPEFVQGDVDDDRAFVFVHDTIAQRQAKYTITYEFLRHTSDHSVVVRLAIRDLTTSLSCLVKESRDLLGDVMDWFLSDGPYLYQGEEFDSLLKRVAGTLGRLDEIEKGG